MWVFIFFSTCYIVGSVNFSILLFKLLGKEDPRKAFSGNSGVVNIYRQAGMLWASVVLLLDVSRAIGVALLSLSALPVELTPWGGFCLILGNRFPCFHRFKGGKGVANYLGFTFILSPVSASCSMVLWCIVYGLFRIPFIASFAMVLVLGIGTIFTSVFCLIHVAGVVMTVIMILFAHSRNIREFRLTLLGGGG